MPNNTLINKYKMDDFQIDNFEPRHLKKANASLEKYLSTFHNHNARNEYKNSILKESSFWEKLKHTLHLD